MKMATLPAANLLLSILIANPVPVAALTRQIVAEIGMRLLLPTNWEWFRRDSNEIFINCSPEKSEGFGCSLIITERKVPAGQSAFSDADRRQWRSWQLATSRSRIIASRDFVLAGYPAYEIISEDPLRSMRVFVLVAKSSRLYEIAFTAGLPANKNADYYRYKPAVDAALQTFAIYSE